MHPRIVRSDVYSEEGNDRKTDQQMGYFEVPPENGKRPFEFDSCSDHQGNLNEEGREHNIYDLALHFIKGGEGEEDGLGLPSNVPRLMNSVC
jgi:hypothetical protein